MAGAMVEGWRAAGIDLGGVTAIRPSGTPVEGVRTVTALPEDETPRFVMLGVKPQKLDEVVPGLARHVTRDTLVVSLLAGVDAATLRRRFPAAGAIVRAMPNLAVAVGQGVTALYSADANRDPAISALMNALGDAPWCKNDDELAVIGALAGSGPAYVARFAAAMGTGGEVMGLDPERAAAIAARTLIGTAALIDRGESFAGLAKRVASPNGTTEQGLAVLDAPGGLQPLVDRMFAAAIARGKAMAAAAAARG